MLDSSRSARNFGAPARAVTHDDDVSVQCLEIERGVLERFALLQTGRCRRNIHDVGAQPEGRQLE